MQVECDLFAEHIDYVEDVCKLISHVAVREAERVRAKHSQVNLHIYGPQVIVASNTFCMDQNSKIAKETFDNFCDMWRYLVNDVIQVAKEILESFKSFSLLGGTATTQPVPSRTYNNSVFQNRHPFLASAAASAYPSRARGQPRQNNINYRALQGQPILTNVAGPLGPQPRMVNSEMISRNAYMDRGPPDGMPIGNEGRWEERRGNGPPYTTQAGYTYNSSRSGLTTAGISWRTIKMSGRRMTF